MIISQNTWIIWILWHTEKCGRQTLVPIIICTNWIQCVFIITRCKWINEIKKTCAEYLTVKVDSNQNFAKVITLLRVVLRIQPIQYQSWRLIAYCIFIIQFIESLNVRGLSLSSEGNDYHDYWYAWMARIAELLSHQTTHTWPPTLAVQSIWDDGYIEESLIYITVTWFTGHVGWITHC